MFVQEPKAKQEVEDLQNEKASNVQFVYCEYVLSLDRFSDSMCKSQVFPNMKQIMSQAILEFLGLNDLGSS